MKVRHTGGRSDEKVDLQMTPMIDIVFQLLIFFLLTFKIASPEGDFNIKMPLAAPSEGIPDDNQLPPLKVRMRADSKGKLAGVQLGTNTLDKKAPFRDLHAQVRDIVGDQSGPGSVAEYVIEAITAVSGYIDPQGNVHKMIEKIKFAPPRGGPQP